MTWKPHVTVAAIATLDNKFLMVEEKIEGKYVYNQPAGHLEPKESLLDAVIRETLEETSWVYKPEALIGIYRWCNPQNNITFLRFAFQGLCLDFDENRTLDPDIHRCLWMTIEELEACSASMRSPLVMQCVRDYLKGIRHPLDILTEF